ncbi:MAG: hypothetical protein RR085_11565, partial [Clostridia bacterium]
MQHPPRDCHMSGQGMLPEKYPDDIFDCEHVRCWEDMRPCPPMEVPCEQTKPEACRPCTTLRPQP